MKVIHEQSRTRFEYTDEEQRAIVDALKFAVSSGLILVRRDEMKRVLNTHEQIQLAKDAMKGSDRE